MSEETNDNSPKPSMLASVVLRGCICNKRNGLQDIAAFCPGPHDKIIPSVDPPPMRIHKTSSDIRAEAPSYKQKKPHRQNVPPQGGKQQEDENNAESERLHPPSEGVSNLHPPITNTPQQLNDQEQVSQQAEPQLAHPSPNNNQQAVSSREGHGEFQGYPPVSQERKQHHRVSPPQTDDEFEGYPPINQKQNYHRTSASHHSPETARQNNKLSRRDERTSCTNAQGDISSKQNIYQEPSMQPTTYSNQQGNIYELQQQSEIPQNDFINSEKYHQLASSNAPQGSIPSHEVGIPQQLHKEEGFYQKEFTHNQRSPREHHESRFREPNSSNDTEIKASPYGRECSPKQYQMHKNQKHDSSHYSYEHYAPPPEEKPQDHPQQVQNSTGVRRSASRKSVCGPNYIEASHTSAQSTMRRQNVNKEESAVSRSASRCSACREHGHKPAIPVRVSTSKKSVCPDITNTLATPVMSVNENDGNKNIIESQSPISPRKPAIRASVLVKHCQCNKRNGLGGDKACRMCLLTSSEKAECPVVNRAEIEPEISPRRNRARDTTFSNYHYHIPRTNKTEGRIPGRTEKQASNAPINERKMSYGDDSDPLANFTNLLQGTGESSTIPYYDQCRQQNLVQQPWNEASHQRELSSYQNGRVSSHESIMASQSPPGYRKQSPPPNYPSQESGQYVHDRKYHQQTEVPQHKLPMTHVQPHEYQNRGECAPAAQEGYRHANSLREVDNGMYQTPTYEYSRQQVQSDPRYVQQTYDKHRQLRSIDSNLTVVGEPQTSRPISHEY